MFYAVKARTANMESVVMAEATFQAAMNELAKWQREITAVLDIKHVDNYSRFSDAEPPKGWHRTLCFLGENELPVLTLWIEPTA